MGLKSDGTVVAVGWNGHGQCNVGDWVGITQVSAGSFYTVGLKSDGTVVAVGNNEYGECNVYSWTDIIQVSASEGHTVGLKSDGTVVAVGWNRHGQCNINWWTGITQVSAGRWHTVGLKSDGTVVAVGYSDSGQCNVGDWVGITQVSAGSFYIVGLKSDGTVVAVGHCMDEQCNVYDWNLASCYYDNGDCSSSTPTPIPTPTAAATNQPTSTRTATTPTVGSVTVSIDAPDIVDKSEGQYFHAFVTITDVTNFDAAQYDITYDPAVIVIQDVNAGDISGTAIPINAWGYMPANTQGTVRISNSVPYAPGVSGEGYLADIYFKVMGDPGDSSVISFIEGFGDHQGYLMIGNNVGIEIPATWTNSLVTIE